jgi:class 3 adenylate cyclase
MPNWFSNVEACWDIPESARWREYVSTFCRLIHFDQPGTGVSDPISFEAPPSLEQWVDSARVVLDAAESTEASVMANDGAFATAAVFAATYPSRTTSLIGLEGYARTIADKDYPFGVDPETFDGMLSGVVDLYGTGELQHRLNRDMPWNEEIRLRWARYERQVASPIVARKMLRLMAELDVRHVLPSIRTPTLIVHHAGDSAFPPEHGRYLAEHIPGARLVVVPGRNLYPIFDDWREIFDEVREFLTGTRGESLDQDRVLATVLFTDIVGSTERAAAIGDRAWKELLQAHHTIVRRELGRFKGREIDTAGDGFLATFDGPARGIRCAEAIRDGLRAIGLEIRAGLHTGEVEIMESNIGGIAVHIGARVSSLAGPSEVLVSRTVTDLVAGSGIEFDDRGAHTLKGVPGEWRLFAVKS